MGEFGIGTATVGDQSSVVQDVIIPNVTTDAATGEQEELGVHYGARGGKIIAEYIYNQLSILMGANGVTISGGATITQSSP